MDIGAILKFIDKSTIKIKDTARMTKVNQQQSRRLAERTEAIAFSLKTMKETDLQRPELRNYLQGFGTCVDQCFQLVQNFRDDMPWYSNVFNKQNYGKEFEELNHELSQCSNHFNIGASLSHLFDPEQDKQDQERDLTHIESNVATIASMMEREQAKQIRQYRTSNERTNQRFNSYKYHLERNILRTNDSLRAQKMAGEEHLFLHIPFYDLHQEQLIGQGGFADVYRGRWLSRDHEVAIKVIRVQHIGETILEDFIQEISTMHRIRYEHIVNVFGACMEPERYALVVEYMPLGSLYDVLHQPTIDLTWDDRWLIALQMTKGINYLHALPKPILHRDIKSLNILMTENAHGFLAKISDFGLAKVRHESSLQSAYSPAVGSLLWKAPELFSLGKHTEASDIYAIGIVLWELATRRLPYEDVDFSIIIAFVRRGDRMEIPREVPNSFAEIISSAWKHEASKRPTCQQLLRLLKNGCPPSDKSRKKHEEVRSSTPTGTGRQRASEPDFMTKVQDSTSIVTKRQQTSNLSSYRMFPDDNISFNASENRSHSLSRSNSPLTATQITSLNILLFGETGIGKSTFINALANYIHFKSLKQARESGPKVLIPTSFLIPHGADHKETTVNFGQTNSNESYHRQSLPNTQQCKLYNISIDNRTKLNIIRTPGVGSSESLEQNKTIMQNIQAFVKKHNHLNAICILLKPNEERFSVYFQLCLTQLLNIIGPNARNNIVFCFTNTRATFYAPANTASLVTKLSYQSSGDPVPFSRSNTFCFDNESLRYLAAVKQGIEFQKEEEREYEQSWIHSAKETNRFLTYIQSLDAVVLANEC